jgi:iron complex transport system substrate-binding protein
MADLRILPLLPSATEIVHALGLGEFQVGRSHECDFPPNVRGLPVCSSPAIAVDGSSAEINSLVKDRLESALSIYNLDSDLISDLKPSHIITQTQCKVCAVSLEEVESAIDKQIGRQTKVISLDPSGLHHLWADILRVGAACGYAERAHQVNADLQNRMSALAETATKARRRPRVAAIEWLEPLMAAGNWVPELVGIAFGENIFGEAGQHSPWIRWEDLVKEDPDIIVALPCGFDLGKTRTEMDWLAAQKGWDTLNAVRSGQVYLCDGNQYMNRPGPRLVESLQIFGEIFHPELFPPALKGTGWDVFECG